MPHNLPFLALFSWTIIQLGSHSQTAGLMVIWVVSLPPFMGIRVPLQRSSQIFPFQIGKAIHRLGALGR